MDEVSLTTRHGRLAVARTGEGPPVLLLHGVPGSQDSWRHVVPLLQGGATVLVPDLLGFGGSSRPADLATLHAGGQADAIEDALDDLGLTDVTVVGHDFGGPVALVLAGRRPDLVSRLGLLATNTFPDTPVPLPLSSLFWPLVGRYMGALLFSRPFLSAMLAMGSGRPRPEIDRRTHLGDAGQLRTIRTLFEGSLRDLAELFAPVQRELEDWSGPAFVAWGDRDPFFRLEQGHRTAATAGVPLTLLSGAGHFLPQERPHAVAAAIAALVRTEIRPRSAGGGGTLR